MYVTINGKKTHTSYGCTRDISSVMLPTVIGVSGSLNSIPLPQVDPAAVISPLLHYIIIQKNISPLTTGWFGHGIMRPC